MQYCCICVDEHIMDEAVDIAEAITTAPTTQVFTAGGQTLASIVGLPVCLEHRRQQLAPVSRAGLVTA
jgi:hypothetical protein